MSSRSQLPQLSGEAFITDGGMETTLIFHEGLDLPCFASFDLLKDAEGTEAIRAYYEPYLEVARHAGAGALLDTPTWRANPDWGARLGYSTAALDDVNCRGVALVEDVRSDSAGERAPVLISGAVGPRGDGYNPGHLMTSAEAERYHAGQIGTFAETAADLVSAWTMTYVEEAVGIVRAARDVGMPVMVSFTVETDGRLPSGTTLKDAVERVDAETEGGAAYFMINCAHPTHFAHVLQDGAPWLGRIGGLRVNASARSHAELDEAEEIDMGDPQELGAQHRILRSRLPNANVVGGCCGTDHRHVAEICRAWFDDAPTS